MISEEEFDETAFSVFHAYSKAPIIRTGHWAVLVVHLCK